jgi:oligoribonuclease
MKPEPSPKTEESSRRVLRKADYLVWMDCEMTGLDPERHVLIEMATLITDSDLHVVAEGPVLAIRQSEAMLDRMDRWCWRTHTKSGLVERVRNSNVSVVEAEQLTLQFVRRHCRIRTAPLCGNSIGQDRRFLVKYMRTLHDFFHYQSIDVSTVKQLARRWYGKNVRPPEKKEAHLALADIRESIAELAFYRERVFVRS